MWKPKAESPLFMINCQVGGTVSNIFEVQKKERIEQEVLELSLKRWLSYG